MKTLIIFSDWKDMMHYAPFEIQGVFPYYSNIIQIMVSTMGNKLYFSKPIIIKDKGKDIISPMFCNDARITKLKEFYEFETICNYLNSLDVKKMELSGCDINNFMDDIVEALKEQCDIIINKNFYYLKEA